MKRIIYISTMLCLAALLAASCTKEITADLKDESGNPVLNGFFHPDSVISIYLTRSKPVLSGAAPMPIDSNSSFLPGYDSIPDATVLVYDNEVPHTLSYDAAENAYRSTWKPLEGHIYRVACLFPGEEKEVSTESQTVLAPKGLSEFSADSTESNGNLLLMARFSIQDEAASEDYYHVILTHRCYMNGELIHVSPAHVDDDEGDPTGASGGAGAFANVAYKEIYPYFGVSFSDAGANGQAIRFKLPLFVAEFPCDGGEARLHAEVRKTSKAYYEYINSVTDYGNYSGGGNPFGTPVQIYNNINNGIGIWATYTVTEHSIPL